MHGILVSKIHRAACGGSYKIVKKHLCQVAGHTCTSAQGLTILAHLSYKNVLE